MAANLCTDCKFSSLDSFFELTRRPEELEEFLYNHRVLPRSKVCPKCGSQMTLDKTKAMFRCRKSVKITDRRKKTIKKQCDTKVSQNNGTWFERCRLNKGLTCRFVAQWAHARTSQQYLKDAYGMSTPTVVDWCHCLREVCIHFINSRSQKLGGPGKMVEIGEAKFGRRKYNEGTIVKGDWVFGIFERGSGKFFLAPVKKRDSVTLLPIIRDHVLPGTTIISDCLQAYSGLQFEGYVHQTVDHKQNFVDPEMGVHTQHVDRLWGDLRNHIPHTCFGNRTHHFHGYLVEYMFHKMYLSTSEQIHNIFSAIGGLYNGSDTPASVDESSSSDSSDEDDPVIVIVMSSEDEDEVE